jgi:hypothetical protein
LKMERERVYNRYRMLRAHVIAAISILAGGTAGAGVSLAADRVTKDAVYAVTVWPPFILGVEPFPKSDPKYSTYGPWPQWLDRYTLNGFGIQFSAWDLQALPQLVEINGSADSRGAETGTYGKAEFHASAMMSYEVAVVPKRPAGPPSVNEVPVLAGVFGWAMCDGLWNPPQSTVGVAVYLSIKGPGVDLREEAGCSNTNLFLAEKPLRFPVNGPVKVTIHADLGAFGHYDHREKPPIDFYGSGTGKVDPVFRIDPSFPYADQYELEYSANLPVPAPDGFPAVMGTAPASGAGSSKDFAFQFAHGSGWENLSVVNVLIDNFLDGRRACYLAYVVPSKTLVLVNDAGDAGGSYAGSVTAGNPGTVIENSQCAVRLKSVTEMGSNLVLRAGITFKPPFGGNRIQYLAARDKAGHNTDWQAAAVWQAPPATDGAIAAKSVNPPRVITVADEATAYTFTFSNTKGAADLGVVNVLVNNFPDGRRPCYLTYVPAANTLYLVNDAGDAGGPFAGAMVLDGKSVIGNSQCTVRAAGSSAHASGNTLTLTLNMSFGKGFAGNRATYLAARDLTGAVNSGWQALGSLGLQ